MGYAVKAGADRTALGDRNGAYCRVDHNKNKHSLKEKGKDAVVYVKVVMPEVDAPIHGDGGAGDGKEAPPAQHAAVLGALGITAQDLIVDPDPAGRPGGKPKQKAKPKKDAPTDDDAAMLAA